MDYLKSKEYKMNEKIKLNYESRVEIGNEIINGTKTVAMAMTEYSLTRGQVKYAVEVAIKNRS